MTFRSQGSVLMTSTSLDARGLEGLLRRQVAEIEDALRAGLAERLRERARGARPAGRGPSITAE